MNKVELLSYAEFSQLRFLDFFPKTPTYSCNDEGGIMTTIGYSCVEGYAENAFAWREDGTKQIGDINLEFGDECPIDLCHALLGKIGIPLRCGMSPDEARLVLGDEDPSADNSDRFVRFIVGEPDRYYVFCAFDNAGGLYRVGVARKDYTDQNNIRMGIS